MSKCDVCNLEMGFIGGYGHTFGLKKYCKKHWFLQIAREQKAKAKHNLAWAEYWEAKAKGSVKIDKLFKRVLES